MNRVPTTILTSYYKLGLLGFKTPKREREKERKKWMLWKFYEFDGMSSEVLKTSNQFVGEGEGCLAPCSSEPCFE